MQYGKLGGIESLINTFHGFKINLKVLKFFFLQENIYKEK